MTMPPLPVALLKKLPAVFGSCSADRQFIVCLFPVNRARAL